MTAEAYTVADNNVGGSPACLQAIAGGHYQIGQMANTTDGRTSESAPQTAVTSCACLPAFGRGTTQSNSPLEPFLYPSRF